MYQTKQSLSFTYMTISINEKLGIQSMHTLVEKTLQEACHNLHNFQQIKVSQHLQNISMAASVCLRADDDDSDGEALLAQW